MAPQFLQLVYISTIIFLITALLGGRSTTTNPLSSTSSSPVFQLVDMLWITFFTLLTTYFAWDISTFCSTIRLNIGSFTISLRREVPKPLILYDNEWNFECLKVRESLSSLGIPVLIYPIPQITTNLSYFKQYPIETRFFADLLISNPTIKPSLPLLYDPNTKAVVYGNGEIVNNYIYSQYSKRLTDIDPPPPLTIGPLDLITSLISTNLRKLCTLQYIIARPSIYNKLPLHLYGTQSDSGTRIVREYLCRLQLHYILFPTSRGSMYRTLLIHHLGSFYYAQRTALIYDRFNVLVAYEHEKKRLLDLSIEKEKELFFTTNTNNNLASSTKNILSQTNDTTTTNNNNTYGIDPLPIEVLDIKPDEIRNVIEKYNNDNNNNKIKKKTTAGVNTSTPIPQHQKNGYNSMTTTTTSTSSTKGITTATNVPLNSIINENKNNINNINKTANNNNNDDSEVIQQKQHHHHHHHHHQQQQPKQKIDNNNSNNKSATTTTITTTILKDPSYYKQDDHKVNSDQKLLLMTTLGTFYRKCSNCMLFDPNTDITAFGMDAIIHYIETMYAIQPIDIISANNNNNNNNSNTINNNNNNSNNNSHHHHHTDG